MNLFLSSCSHSRSLLKFDLATVGAAVRQRLCLKAVMADIAEIVVHSVCTSNLCSNLYFIRILLYPKVILDIGDALTGKIGNVVEGNDDRQLFLNAHSFSIAVLHDLQFSINWVDHNNCAGQTQVVTIHHIITKDTVDEDVMAALEQKDMTQEKLISAVKARLEE